MIEALIIAVVVLIIGVRIIFSAMFWMVAIGIGVIGYALYWVFVFVAMAVA